MWRHRPEALARIKARKAVRQHDLMTLIVLCAHHFDYNLKCRHCGIGDQWVKFIEHQMMHHDLEAIIERLPASLSEALDTGIRNGLLDPIPLSYLPRSIIKDLTSIRERLGLCGFTDGSGRIPG